MNMQLGSETEFHHGDILLYVDDKLLFGATQYQNRFQLLDDSAEAAPTLPSHLSAILHEYTCSRNYSGPGKPLAPLQQRFEIIAQTTPGAHAVSFNGRRLTYGELDSQADELALSLQRDGLLPGSYCAISLEPSLAHVRVILAVLKAGAACLHLDPGLSPARVAAVLAVFRPTILFRRDSERAPWSGSGMRTIHCGEDAADLPYGWPDECPVGAGTPAHAFATVSDNGSLSMSVRTHKALGACLDAMRGILPLAAPAPDPANFWRHLSEGALLTIAPRACGQ